MASIICYGHSVRLLPDITSFGVEEYFARAYVYSENLHAIFLWLTPFAVSIALLLMTFPQVPPYIATVKTIWNRLPEWFFSAVIPCIFMVIAAWTAIGMVGAVPRIFDGFNYHFQARNFALGQFYAVEPPISEYFQFPFIIIENGKWYGSVYPGYSILLAAGVMVGLDWLVNPILGGIAIVLLYFASREMFSAQHARIVAVFALLSPFFRMMSSIFMAHTTSIVFVTLSLWMLFRWSQKKHATSAWTPFWAGFAMAWLYITRPQAGVVTLPVMLLYTAFRIRWHCKKHIIAFVVPLICALLFLAVYNHQLTGDYTVNPRYYVDPDRRLGFGHDLGEPLANGLRSGHDLARGLRNSLLLISLWNAEMFGWGTYGAFGWMTVLVFAACICDWKKPLSWILTSSIFLNVVLYVFYYTPSPNFGPRYMAEIIPATLFLSVRGFMCVHDYFARRESPVLKPAFFICLVMALFAVSLVTLLPLHWTHYGILPQKMERSRIGIQGNNNVVFFPDKLYCMNIYTWNSPDLNGNIYLPLKGALDLQRFNEAFPERKFFKVDANKDGFYLEALE